MENRLKTCPAKDFKLDVVLQATGYHSWNVGEGWSRTAEELGMVNRTFRPRARWGEACEDDDGLYSYLGNAQSAAMLLLGFDWHSQALHNSPRWRERWQNAGTRKIIYVQESVHHSVEVMHNTRMVDAFGSAAALGDFVIYTDCADRSLVERQGKPSLWLPFGVDTGTFRQTTPYHARKRRAYFRGKTHGWTARNEYAARARLLARVVAEDLVDVIGYQNKPLRPETLVDEFNRYQVAVNFPSVFSNHPTRVAEGMACGSLMMTNRTGIPAVDSMFEDNRHLIYYNDADELVASLENCVRDEDRCADIAAAGQAHVAREFSLAKQLATILRAMT